MDNSAFLDASSQRQPSDNSAFTDAAQSNSPMAAIKDNAAANNSAFTDLTPSDVATANKYLGSNDYNGWCEAWQEKVSGSPNMGGTAAQAWKNYAQQGKAYEGLQGAKPGDKIYFSGDGGYGHTGIITSIDPQTGDATFISATDNGVKEHQVSNWLQSTGQQLLGFVQ